MIELTNQMDEPALLPITMETAKSLQENTERMNAYLTQMGLMMFNMETRLKELEEKQRATTLTHDEVKDVQTLIRNRSWEYCEKYNIQDGASRKAVAAAIRKAILTRYQVKDLHDVPAIARQAVEMQISRWADIRLVMKRRERIAQSGG